MESIILIIEKADEGFFGRVQFEDDLLIENAVDVPTLEMRIKTLLKNFHDLDPAKIRFERQFDLSALFDNFYFLNVAAIAELSGMNITLLRQYKNKVKFPSAKQAKKIEDTIREIGAQLIDVHIFSK
jgi:hypothetical protein